MGDNQIMEISVKHDIDKLLPQLAKLNDSNMRFVVASALTKTGKRAQEEIKKAMPSVFDRPTPYTLNSTYLRPATKMRLEALVKIKDEAYKGIGANKWLHAEVFGGQRNMKRSERSLQIKGVLKDSRQIVPAKSLPLDSYGNVKAGQMSKILSAVQASSDPYQNATKASRKRGSSRKRKAEYFVGSPGGGRLPMGVWQRTSFAYGSAIKPVLIFARKGTYKKRLPFHDIVTKVTRDEFETFLWRQIQEELMTRR